MMNGVSSLFGVNVSTEDSLEKRRLFLHWERRDLAGYRWEVTDASSWFPLPDGITTSLKDPPPYSKSSVIGGALNCSDSGGFPINTTSETLPIRVV